MKKMIVMAVVVAALVCGVTRTYAENGWATAGKVLTGVLAADILLNHTGGGYAYGGGGYGYGYGGGGVGFSYSQFGHHSGFGVSYYSGPPAYYYPAPVYYYPAPVYYAPCYPRYYRCYPAYRW